MKLYVGKRGKGPVVGIDVAKKGGDQTVITRRTIFMSPGDIKFIEVLAALAICSIAVILWLWLPK